MCGTLENDRLWRRGIGVDLIRYIEVIDNEYACHLIFAIPNTRNLPCPPESANYALAELVASLYRYSRYMQSWPNEIAVS